MKKHVKIILLAAVLLLSAVIGVVLFNQSLPVTVTEVQPDTARLYFTEKGIVEPEEEVSVFPLVSGKVLEIYVKENQYVSQGEPLCKIDPANTQFEIEQTQAQIRSLEAQRSNVDTEEARQKDTLIINKNKLHKELETLETQESSVMGTKEEQIRLQNILIAQNEEDIARAEKDLARLETLYQNGIVSASQLETGQKALEGYQTQYNQNKQQLEMILAGSSGQTSEAYYQAMRNSLQQQVKDIDASLAKSYTKSMKDYYTAQIEQANVLIEKLTKLKEDSVVTATASGIIISLPVQNTNVAAPGSPIAVVGNGKNLLAAYVATKDINAVSPGKEVDLVLKRREGDEIYKGRIYKVDDKAGVKISSLGVEERKVKVYVEPVEQTELFKTGYDADIRFLVYEKENAFILPKTAVFKDGDGYAVWQAAGGRLQKTEVTRGMEVRSDVVIEAGLSPGVLVVTDASLEELKEGVKVSPQVGGS